MGIAIANRKNRCDFGALSSGGAFGDPFNPKSLRVIFSLSGYFHFERLFWGTLRK